MSSMSRSAPSTACCRIRPRWKTCGALQQNLVSLMGELACRSENRCRAVCESAFAKISAADVQRLGDAVTEARGPAGSSSRAGRHPRVNTRAAAIDQARVVARRAERRLVALPAHGRNVAPRIAAVHQPAVRPPVA